jgi:hypothetical protein
VKKMKKIISIISFLLMFALPIFATPTGGVNSSGNEWTSNGNTKAFTGALYCIPSFNVSGDGQGIGNSYTRFIGNYYIGYSGTVNHLDIVWKLTGPGEYYDNTDIDYSVVTTHQHWTTSDGASISVNWAIQSKGFSPPHVGGGFTYNGSDAQYIHLIQGSDNCSSYATFTATSLTVDLSSSPNIEPGLHTFYVKLEASVVI